jgi:hypothetical protein
MRFVRATSVLVFSLLASCSGGDSGSGGTSALARQFFGHWSTASNDNLYFGQIDPASQTGSYVLVHPDGKSFTHRYEIESEDSGDRTIHANLLFATGDSRETTYVISEDGNSMESATIITGIETHSLLTKVDATTGP